MAVGIPMLAAELLTTRATSDCLASTQHTFTPPHIASDPVPIASILQLLHVLVEEALTLLRAVYLTLLFTPVVLSIPLAGMSADHRTRWLELVRWTLERAGPAFIKWGQWAATRPDLFAPDLCTTLETLQAVWLC